MKIAIVGAGGAGLVSAKYAIDEGHACDVFEQSGFLGGTWNYTERVGTDEYGVPIHTAMYKGLRTNLPKEVMEFMNFSYPKQKKSFIYQPEVIQYLQSYADKFNLNSAIRYHKQVVYIDINEHNKWLVTVRDAKTKENETKLYDAVMVCNGHYSEPTIPTIKGQSLFRGNIIHSRDYRTPEPYINKTVLVIGSGPSGRDITNQIASVTNKVFLCHRTSMDSGNFPPNVIKKGVVMELLDDSVKFENEDEKQYIDTIIYCTGYKYYFPFLSSNCKISVDNNHVQPLYKHLINIEHPTMAFIGLVFQITPFPLFDIQARFFLKTLREPSILPTKEAMYKDLKESLEENVKRALPLDHAHYCGEKYQPLYFNELARLANITPIPSVVNKIFCKNKCTVTEEIFEIIDDDNYIIH